MRSLVGNKQMSDDQASFERERIKALMLIDAFNAVEAIYGVEGLAKVTSHMKASAKARERNDEIDALDVAFGDR